MKVLVIGIDGATWDIIDPLINFGKLENLGRLISRGVHGKLESSIPPVTGPAWVSFATGKNPGKHGCYDFVLPQNHINELKAISSLDIQGKTIYEILNSSSKKSIIINLPVSDPPQTSDFFLSSFLVTNSNYVHPPNLKDKMPILREYRLFPNMKLKADEKIREYIDDIREVERIRFECAKSLLKRDWDFFFVLFSGTDWLQHVAYRDIYNWTRNSTSISEEPHFLKLYKEIDSYVGWFMNNLPNNAILLLMSDHGFKSYSGIFYVNEWLRRKGYLNTSATRSTKTIPHKLEEEFENAKRNKRNISIPSPIITSFVRIFGRVLSLPKLYLFLRKYLHIEISINKSLDSENSKVYMPTSECGGLYINSRRRFESGNVENYDKIRDTLVEELCSLLDYSSSPIFKQVLKKEEVYKGDNVQYAPDIILIPNNYTLSPDLIPLVMQSGHSRYTNNHDINGIFLAYGQKIKRDHEIKSAKIYDIAPTILHIFGLPIPNDMDGRVLTEIFEPDSELAKRKPKYVDPSYYEKKDEKEKIKEEIGKLKKLGKI